MEPPPVPPIPPRFAAYTSFPVNPIPQHLPAPPVRPTIQPFAFERQLNQRQQPQAGPSNHQQVPYPRSAAAPFAAPPSHHTPVMGLGGALISSNNSRAQQEAAAARLAHMRNAQLRRRSNALLNSNVDDFLLRDQEDDHGPHIRRWIDAQQEQLLRLYHRLRGREAPPPKYLHIYTHPRETEPGFTPDFAPNASDEGSPRDRRFPATSANAPIIIDDDDEVSMTFAARPLASAAASSSSSSSAIAKMETSESRKLSVLLVCARCLDPLLVNESLGPDDNGRRVWALRCGHMIDEKCLNEIGQPEEPEPEVQTPSSVTDRKGKGKAKAKHRASYGEAAVRGVDTTTNSIRSRLRSAAASGAASTFSASAVPSSSHTPSPARPLKRRRAAAAVRKIEAEFEWRCPVPSCGLVHASVKIDGKWGPEQEGKIGITSESLNTVNSAKAKPRGAIPVFA